MAQQVALAIRLHVVTRMFGRAMQVFAKPGEPGDHAVAPGPLHPGPDG